MVENNTSNETVSTEQTTNDPYRNAKGNRRGWNLRARTKEERIEHGKKGAEALAKTGNRFLIEEYNKTHPQHRVNGRFAVKGDQGINEMTGEQAVNELTSEAQKLGMYD